MNAELVAFLADSLALWNVDGDVVAGSEPVVAVIRARDCVVTIERHVDDDAPWRWFVRWHEANASERSRPCASIPGLLNALRRALDVERGSALRVVANAASALPA